MARVEGKTFEFLKNTLRINRKIDAGENKIRCHEINIVDAPVDNAKMEANAGTRGSVVEEVEDMTMKRVEESIRDINDDDQSTQAPRLPMRCLSKRLSLMGNQIRNIGKKTRGWQDAIQTFGPGVSTIPVVLIAS